VATVAIAFTILLLPALASAGVLAAVEVLLATLGLELLLGRCGSLHGRNLSWLGLGLEALLPGAFARDLGLALPPATTAALGLSHAMGNGLAVVLCVSLLG
jgi:hypothetical protein